LPTNVLNEQLALSKIDRNAIANLILQVGTESGEISGNNLLSDDLPYSTISNVISRFNTIPCGEHNDIFTNAYSELLELNINDFLIKYNTTNFR